MTDCNQLNILVHYIAISGIFMVIYLYLVLNWNIEGEDKTDEIRSAMYTLPVQSPEILLYMVCLLFGWFIVPVCVINRIYRFITGGKDLF